MFNSTFYPTPKNLAEKMIEKIEGEPCNILDPSAGKGDILNAVNEKYSYSYHRLNLAAIEIDTKLQAILRGQKIKVIDSDFLAFAGLDKFDLILMNPPFDEGDKHLLKALDVMYRGQIICLLNAETLRNPYTNTRKILVSRLDELDAEIEFIQDAFVNAERPTGVEVALINIVITHNVEEDLFTGCNDTTSPVTDTAENTTTEIAQGKNIEEMIYDYQQTIDACTQTITDYYKNYRRTGKYLGLNCEANKYCSHSDDMTTQMQDILNETIVAVRKDYWLSTLDLDEINSRLTSDKRNELYHQLETYGDMEFTAANVRQFVVNLIGSYKKTLMDAVLKLFDKFTDHSYNNGPNEKNVHYFNGWKTNSAWKINRRIVIPIYGGCWGSPFTGYNGKWELNHNIDDQLHDIDLVMRYFDGKILSWDTSLNEAVNSAFGSGQNRNIESKYFICSCFKKGTIHLTFKDEDILRQFNKAACVGKNWLPQDYGVKPYTALTTGEKSVVDEFEGRKSYEETRKQPLFVDEGVTLPALKAA